MEARRRALGAWRGGEVEGVWHMRQMVSNACGAVAIVHLVMNTLGRVSGPAAGSGETARDGGKTARDEGGEMARGGAAAVQGAGSEAPEMLRDFGRAMQGDSAHERGRRLAPALRQVHAELAGQGQTSAPRSSAVLAFHFISLVEVRVWCVHGMCVPCKYQARTKHMPCAYHAHASQVHGRLYELDGNNDGPLDCGGVGDGGFLTAAVRHGQGQ
mgnify:CR=1 FL=1